MIFQLLAVLIHMTLHYPSHKMVVVAFIPVVLWKWFDAAL